MSSLISTTASKDLQALIVKASGVKPAHKTNAGVFIDVLTSRKENWDGLDSLTRARVSTAWYAVQWALKTGRLNFDAETKVKKSTPYQMVKLVAQMATSFSTVQACVDFLNGK